MLNHFAKDAEIPLELEVRVKLHLSEAEALARLTPFLFVGNNRYEVAGLEIGRRVSLTSGRLWVCTAPAPIAETSSAWLGGR